METTETAVRTDEVRCFLAPCGARVVVREDSFEYKGMLSIPEVSKRRPTTGKIVAVGPGVLNIAGDDGFKLGDRVLFANFSGTLCQFEQKPAFRILSVEEILAKITTTDVLDYTAA